MTHLYLSVALWTKDPKRIQYSSTYRCVYTGNTVVMSLTRQKYLGQTEGITSACSALVSKYLYYIE